MRVEIRLLVLFVLLVAVIPLFGVTTGTIRGSVADSSGAAVAGAQVTAVNEATNETRGIASDATGSFQFLSLAVGKYTLRVERTGFKTYLLKGIVLEVNQVATFSVTLEVGTVESKVEVTANPAQVDTAATQIGTVIDSRPILDLPLNERNLYQLVALQPGISVPSQGTRGVVDPNNPVFAVRQAGSPLVFSSSGGRMVMNNFMVDGSDTNGILENQAVVRAIPDSVEEFRVLTNTFNAEYGRNAGSIVNIITRAGTNNWHGDGFEFFRNEVLNARNFFEASRAPFKLNQFGGTIGGPVRKDKTFIFGSYQATRRRQGVSGQVRTVFSDAERMGQFIDREPGGFTGSSTNMGRLSNNLCFPRDATVSPNCFAAGTPFTTIFPGAVIPTSFFDPITQNILNSFIPRANAGTPLRNELLITPVEPTNAQQFSIKLNHELGRGHKLSALFFFDDVNQQNFAIESDAMPGFPVVTAERDLLLNIGDAWVISPTTLNEFRFGYLRQAVGKTKSPLHTFDPASIGFTGILTGPPLAFQTMPVIKVAGGPIFGSPSFGSGGGSNIENVFQFSDTFSKLLGNHSLKFGGDFRRIYFDQVLLFVFDGDFTFGGSGANSTGDPLADFLLGLPDNYIQGAESFEHLRTNLFHLFAQDTWQVRPNLTLNYGLRWELNTPFIDRDNLIDEFKFPPVPGQPLPQSKVFSNAPPGLVFPGDPGVPRGLTNTYYKSYAPRVGLAYSPAWFGAGRTVIRAAYGIFYAPIEQSILLQFNGDPPFGGSSFVGGPGFASPFTNQAGATLPSPFPFMLPKPGSTVNFSSFFPIFLFGDFSPTLRSQYLEQYNLMVEYQLSPTMLVAGGYVGSQGHRLLASFDANPGNPQLCMTLASLLCGPFGEDVTYTTATQTFFGTRPVGPLSNNGSIEAFGNIFTLSPVSNSNYHSAQLRFERRAADLQLLASYTFSKSIDNTSGFENLLNPFCFKCDRNLSAFDVRHRAVISFTYRLPFGRAAGVSGLRQKLIGGWEIGSISTFQSGVPVHLTDSGSDNSLSGGFDFETADRPQLVGPVRTQDPRHSGCSRGTGPGQPLACASVANQSFDPNSFAVEPLGKFGNVPHNLFSGPGVNNWDFTVIKRTPFRERYSWEFRAEFFNLWNHAQFLNPNGDINAGANFGRIQGARDPRFVQFATKILF
jgi:hypothetical protein